MFAYIASPYTHEDPEIRHKRYIEACNFVRWVALTVKLTPYSPIVHWHDIAVKNDLPKDHEFWNKMDKDLLVEATTMYVLGIDGWKESKGIASEVLFATRHKINSVFAEPRPGANNEPHYHITPLKYKIVKG